jgi:hypothetical protein
VTTALCCLEVAQRALAGEINYNFLLREASDTTDSDSNALNGRDHVRGFTAEQLELRWLGSGFLVPSFEGG